MFCFKSNSTFLLYSLISLVSASSYVPGDNWSTLTPDSGIPESVTTDHFQTFGISIEPIVSSVSLTSATPTTVISFSSSQQRDYSRIITQIGDGQVQGTFNSKSLDSSLVLSTDEATTTYFVDKTLLTTTFTTVPCSTQASHLESSYSNSTSLKSSSSKINNDENTTTIEIATTLLTTKYTTVGYSIDGVSSSIDITTTISVTPTTYVIVTKYGSLSGTTTVVKSHTLTATAYVSNTETSSVPSDTAIPTSPKLSQRDITVQSCLNQNSLAMTLNGTIITDSKGRIGSIVANRQFQFDGPPPQAGAIFAAGWYIEDGKLGLGNTTTFYQCLSGNFYNLYDAMIGEHCEAVKLNVVDLVAC